LNGRVFQLTEGTAGNYTVYTDKINSKDNWGGKVKLTYASGSSSGMAAAMGLANGGADNTITYILDEAAHENAQRHRTTRHGDGPLN
jgi:hypothetical protein